MKATEHQRNLVRTLGRTGIEVTVLGLGGHTYPVGRSSESFQSPEDRALLVRRLVSAGVNYFDTTWLHEVRLLADSFRRANIKENTFVSLQYVDGMCDHDWRRKIRQEIEKRLRIMNYTHAPLFLLGMGNEDIPYAEFTAALEKMKGFKEEGLIQNIGISCHRIDLFPLISRAIRETDLIDYITIRFNWKFRQANDELFPIAKDYNVGIVIMKTFCWDCGPSEWARKISVFEPIRDEERFRNDQSLTPGQRNLLWSIKNSRCDVALVAMNTMWEVDQNIQAIQSMNLSFETDDLKLYSTRLWDKKELEILALHAESEIVRNRAKNLLGHSNCSFISHFYHTIRDYLR